jgi:hypothetical protein
MERGPCGGSTDGFPVVPIPEGPIPVVQSATSPRCGLQEEMAPIVTRLHQGAWAASVSGRTVACRAIAIKVNLLAVSA